MLQDLGLIVEIFDYRHDRKYIWNQPIRAIITDCHDISSYVKMVAASNTL